MTNRAFTLIEVLVGTAIFLAVATAAYSAFASLFTLAAGVQARTLAVELADEQFEIIRNMPYASVGLTNGIPNGILPQTQTLVRGGISFTVTLTVRNINFSTTTIQASDKLVEIDVSCSTCKNFDPVTLTGQVSPANLQSASNGGALTVKAFDSSGKPIQGATVIVQSTATSSIQNTDVTNNDGALNIIGVPQGTGVYRIAVSKPGYTTERTYAYGSFGASTPSRPDANVLNQQVTTASFAIDLLSSLHITSVTALCAPVPNVHFNLYGSKVLATSPTVLKFSQSTTTNSLGVRNIDPMEWDTYSLVPTDTLYDVAGINPYSPFTLNPGNAQNVQLVMVPKNGNSLMVTVTDSLNGTLPLSGATVRLTGPGYDETQVTGQGYVSQSDWSAGSGQSDVGSFMRYWTDNGQVDVSTSSGNVLMKSVFGEYATAATGTLESSTFDTGTSSNFYTFSWNPVSQALLAGESPLKFQFAASPTAAPDTWDYKGPDGTSGTYYTVPGSAIAASHNGNRFARYMAYLTTQTATVTPILSDASFSYTSACIPPGQVLFQGLSAGQTYYLSVSKAGYTAQSNVMMPPISTGWQEYMLSL